MTQRGAEPTTPRRGVFVTGTGTGVGKSIVSAAVTAALAARGERVAPFKPVVTGTDEPDAIWPADHVLLAEASGRVEPGAVAALTFGPAVSPHLAAELAGTQIDSAALLDAFSAAAAGADVIVCEGVGGLLVPLSVEPAYTVLDLIADIGLPVVVATHPGLGTISDTCLTVERVRDRGLVVRGVVMTPWPERPERIHASNAETIERLAGVTVSRLPETTRERLAAAGELLPLDTWVAPL